MLNKTSIRNLTILLGGTLTVLAVATISPALPEMSLFFQDLPNAEFLVRMVLTIPGLSIRKKDSRGLDQFSGGGMRQVAVAKNVYGLDGE